MIPQKIRDQGFTDEEVIKIVEQIAGEIAPKYSFGYYDDVDMIQEACILAFEALENFEPDKGTLKRFLRVHLSNRMKDFKRNNYFKPGTKNSVDKINVMNPLDICSIDGENESNMRECKDIYLILDYKEMIEKINVELPVDYRRDYLKLLDGLTSSMTLRRKREVIAKIKEIVNG